MVKLSSSKIILFLGLLSAILYGFFLIIDPLNRNIIPFLSLFFSIFLIYLIGIFLLEKSPFQLKNSLFLLIGFSFLFRILMFFTVPTLSDDIYRYAWDGIVQKNGINPYIFPPTSNQLASLRPEWHSLINHPDVRTIYPPVAQMFFLIGSFFSSSIMAQKFLFSFFDLATIGVLFLILKKKQLPLKNIFIYAWNPLVILEFSGSGHIDSLMIFFLFLGFYFWECCRIKWSHSFFAISFLSKFTSVVMIPWLLLKENVRKIWVFVFVIILLSLPYLFHMGEIIHEWSSAVSGVTTFSKDWAFNSSFYGLLGWVIKNTLYRKIFIGLCLILFSFWWAQKNKLNPIQYAFGCFFLLLSFSPIAHPWYVCWLVPFMVFIPLLGGILWSGLIVLTYHVLISYVSEGIWNLSSSISIIQYFPVYLCLIFEFFYRKKKGKLIINYDNA
ncbi:MAG: glycosyltransferase 87 family protein [Elusimicrobiota bacterium]